MTKRGTFPMEDLFKMFNCNKVVDKQKQEYVWVQKDISHDDMACHLRKGDLREFVEFLALQSNESLKAIDYEDFFDKFSNDYMIEMHTMHDDGVRRKLDEEVKTKFSFKWMPPADSEMDLTTLDDEGAESLVKFAAYLDNSSKGVAGFFDSKVVLKQMRKNQVTQTLLLVQEATFNQVLLEKKFRRTLVRNHSVHSLLALSINFPESYLLRSIKKVFDQISVAAQRLVDCSTFLSLEYRILSRETLDYLVTIKKSLGEKRLSEAYKDRLVSRQLENITFETIPYHEFEAQANVIFEVAMYERLQPKQQEELKLLTCVMMSNREEVLLYRMERLINDAYQCFQNFVCSMQAKGYGQ